MMWLVKMHLLSLSYLTNLEFGKVQVLSLINGNRISVMHPTLKSQYTRFHVVGRTIEKQLHCFRMGHIYAI